MRDVPVYDEEGGPSRAAAKGENLVFLIGDSIRMGFQPYLQRALEGQATLVAPEENCRYTQYTYTSLAGWKELVADPAAVRLVYWNNGHWDAAHWDGDPQPLNTEPEYAAMLVRIYGRLQRYFPNAKILFATTTPPNPNGTMGPNPRSRAEIARYNQAAKAALLPLGVEVDDLYAFLQDWGEAEYADYVHLTERGFERLGHHVAETIRNALNR